MQVPEEKLKGFLVDAGLAAAKDIEDAQRRAEPSAGRQSFADVLVADGKLAEHDLARVEAYLLGIPYIDVGSQKIDLETLSLIPEPIARAHSIVAYKQSPEALEVAMLQTADLPAIDFVRKKTGLKILPRLTSAASIKRALVQYQKSLKDDFGEVIRRETGSLKVVGEGDNLKKVAEDVPVVRVVDTLLKHAVLQSASDIHIEPQELDVLVRYRVDGLLREAMTLPKSAASAVTARVKVLANLKLDEKRLPQDGRFKQELDGEKVAFRVSILPTVYGEKVVMRLLREGGGGFTLESLGFHGDGLERIHAASRQSTGMILTTGPTGSGKSTTLYTILDLLNTPDVNISTIEDPVEYQLKRVNQTQVNADIGFNFSDGLRSLVRQDPDIIMVGEIRDGETASLAINAALTGHLVLSTLHTNSAAGTIPRLVDMGAQPFLLVSTLRVIVAQRLVRKLGQKKEKYTLTKDGLVALEKTVDMGRVLKVLQAEKIVKPEATWLDIPLFRPLPQGDGDDGYHSRVGIHEVMAVSEPIRQLIISGAPDTKIEEQAKAEGMMTMVEDGIFKAVLGHTTIEEVLRVISE
jgi:type IV pilus assembly protein PilB